MAELAGLLCIAVKEQTFEGLSSDFRVDEGQTALCVHQRCGHFRKTFDTALVGVEPRS